MYDIFNERLKEFSVGDISYTFRRSGDCNYDIRGLNGYMNDANHRFKIYVAPQNGRMHFWAMSIPNGIGKYGPYWHAIEVARHLYQHLEEYSDGWHKFGVNLKAGGFYYNHWCNEFMLTDEMTSEEIVEALKNPPYTGLEPFYAFRTTCDALAGSITKRQIETVANQP